MTPDSDPKRESEIELMRRVRMGEADAMREFVVEYEVRLRRWITRLSGWRTNTDDLLQEVLVQVWRKASSFRGQGPLEGWVRRIAVNRCRNDLRRRLTFERFVHAFGRTRSEAECRDESNDAVDELKSALNRLRPNDRTLLVLFYLEELSGEEVAEALNIRVDAVHVRLSRARQRLKRLLSHEQTIQREFKSDFPAQRAMGADSENRAKGVRS